MDKKVLLTDELDNTPYCYNDNTLEKVTKNILEKKNEIENYFSKHPKARKAIFTSNYRSSRYTKNALSYLTIEGDDTLDIVPYDQKSPEEKRLLEAIIKKLVAYINACKFAYCCATKEDYKKYSYDPIFMCTQIHQRLISGEDDVNTLSIGRLRNENDSAIIVGKGVFNPVEGKDVAKRIQNLFADMDFSWKDKDNIFARYAKFMTEYIRIQPHKDGNKRMALILLNYYLESEGYEDIYFKSKEINKIYKLVNDSLISRDVTGLAYIIAKTEENRYENIIDKIRTYRAEKYEQIINSTMNEN